MISETKRDKKIIDNAEKDLKDYIKRFLPRVCIVTVDRALEFGRSAHHGQKRASGDPYITHPIAVAKILADLHLDTQTIVSAILHDVVEDTKYTIQDIRDKFGDRIAQIVAGLTKINKIEHQNFAVEKAENLRKLLIAVAEDARVLLIKLADRLHNMRTLSCIKEHRRRMRIAKDTIDIYAPLADRIGIHFFKNALYDLGFEALYPQVRASIIEQVGILKEKGYEDITKIVNDITSLMKESKVDAEVKGREKTPFSIWQKMEKKKIYFDELSDIFAVRIITNDPLECYMALGVIHMNYPVISKEFFDYISTPKQNGYRSIHTVVLVSDSIKVEIQIRTAEMNHISELGMAAHWIYKHNGEEVDDEYQQKWLKRIRSIMENITDTSDILANIKLEMYYDQVFCFTPRGDVIALPKGATPLDFAFEVSIDLGAYYNKAIVNGKPVGINTRLQSGDQVEIITSDHITITHHWFDVISTTKARSEIQVYLEKKLFESLVFSGHLSIQDECEKNNVEISDDKLEQVAELYNISLNDLLFNIGNGTIRADKVIERLTNRSIYKRVNSIIKNGVQNKDSRKFKNLVSLKHNAEIRFAYCCKPTAGDMAFGIYNSQTKSFVVHASTCHNLQIIDNTEEIFGISLNDNTSGANAVEIEVSMKNHQVIGRVFLAITEFGISKYNIDITHSGEDLLIIFMHIKLIIPHQLEALMNKIRNISDVIDVTLI